MHCLQRWLHHNGFDPSRCLIEWDLRWIYAGREKRANRFLRKFSNFKISFFLSLQVIGRTHDSFKNIKENCFCSTEMTLPYLTLLRNLWEMISTLPHTNFWKIFSLCLPDTSIPEYSLHGDKGYSLQVRCFGNIDVDCV